MSSPTGPPPSASPSILREGLIRLGISLELPGGALRIRQLHAFLGELERWNHAYHFVKAGGPELIIRHVLDSLTAVPLLHAWPQRDRILDVGSGAGFPGIPLAVFLPNSSFTLLEPAARKAAFLRTAALLARLTNVEVRESRLEGLDSRFDLVVCRAFRPLPKALPALRRVLAPGGAIIAYKGRRDRLDRELEEAGLMQGPPEPAAGQAVGLRVEAVRVPFYEEAERHLVVITTAGSGS